MIGTMTLEEMIEEIVIEGTIETQETQEITEIEINTEDKNMIETTIRAETTEEAVMTTEEKEMREDQKEEMTGKNMIAQGQTAEMTPKKIGEGEIMTRVVTIIDKKVEQ